MCALWVWVLGLRRLRLADLKNTIVVNLVVQETLNLFDSLPVAALQIGDPQKLVLVLLPQNLEVVVSSLFHLQKLRDETPEVILLI